MIKEELGKCAFDYLQSYPEIYRKAEKSDWKHTDKKVIGYMQRVSRTINNNFEGVIVAQHYCNCCNKMIHWEQSNNV